ncbi:MAG: type secretion rane fusion protein HlyD family [Herminiimonas sp.]|nr:type secretion rane fusion protein HlyD family [Herminiimonas sp.]
MAITSGLLKGVPSPASPIEDESPPARNLDTGFGHASRVGLWALLTGFVGLVLWAGFAPLDEGVPSQGHVAIDTKRKAVQHLSGGIIKEVLVGEGEQVREGQLLVKLDDATARANLESVRQRYFGFLAMQGRLLTELSGERSIHFHPDLQAAAVDPLIRQQMVNQEHLLQSRRGALRAAW